MAEEVSPAVARRRLRLALRDARERAGKTQQEVAEEMEWSLSKVIRIENGDNTIAPNDLRPLVAYIGVKDRATVGEWLAMAKVARQRPPAWYQKADLRPYLTDPMRRLFDYESEAVTARYYYVTFVAGPLQTEDYAVALVARYEEEMDSVVIEARLRARQLRRQKLLERAEAGEIEVRVLLDESVLMRTIGGPAVLVGQLRELQRLSVAGLIKLRMVPFDATAAVTNNASFDLLTLPDAGEVLYRETGIRDETVEDNATTRRHRERYDLVWLEVADESDTIDYLRKRIAVLEATISNRREE